MAQLDFVEDDDDESENVTADDSLEDTKVCFS